MGWLPGGAWGGRSDGLAHLVGELGGEFVGPFAFLRACTLRRTVAESGNQLRAPPDRGAVQWDCGTSRERMTPDPPGVPTVRGQRRATLSPHPSETAMNVRGACVLLLEDDALISLDAEEMLLELGVSRVLAAHNLADAGSLIEGSRIDAAVLDISIGRARSDGLARALAARCIPFVFTSGYAHPDALPEDIRHVPIVEKPFSAEILAAAFRSLPPAPGRGD